MIGERLLSLDSVTMRFGGLTAVDSLNLHVDQGEILGLIGPNGAGKTTVFNMVTGVYTPTEGDILFDGTRLNGLRPHKVTYQCHACGLRRHDPDAVHCKACGDLLNIPDDGV
jgi:branched-chain amino acid transport system ATP-binding protein